MVFRPLIGLFLYIEAMEIYVRRAERSDVPQMLVLLDYLDAWHQEAYPDRFRPIAGGGRTPHSLIKEMAEPSSEYWVAVKSGKVLGLTFLLHRQIADNPVRVPETYLLLDMLVVDPAFQRKGIGKMLVEQAQKRAREEGYKRVSIKVYENNRSAMDFYQALGYQTLIRTLEYKLDDPS